jgi:exopolysaccharide biosynthesis polyprenyl glycosylphosphotransferase
MKNNVSLIYNLCLLVGDSLALVAAFTAAYILRVKLAVGLNIAPLGPTSGKTFIGVFLLVLPFWLLIFALLGLYNHSIYEKRFVEFGRLLVGSFIGLLFVIFWNFIATEPIFPARLVPIYGFAFGFVLLVIFRNVARFVRSRLFSFEIGLTKVLLVGNTRVTQELLNWLADSRKSGYRVVGVVGGRLGIGSNHHVPLYRGFDEFLKAQGSKTELHGIIQTELYADEGRNAKILAYAQENHISYRFVPGNTELFVGNIEVELFRSSIPVLHVHHTALFGWGRVVKRMFDLIAGGLALTIASPIMIILALIIKITEPRSPILFKPRRTGRYGHNTAIYKFRSMKQDYSDMSPEEGFTKMGKPELIKAYRNNGDQLENDPRVTAIGRLMRRTSLDELPQLINIVRGDISLVGPRALDPFELDQYSKKNLILAVKTGLTGLAQVSGRRDISFEQRRKLDLYYVQNWSFWMDLVILVKTVRVVLGGRGTN